MLVECILASSLGIIGGALGSHYYRQSKLGSFRSIAADIIRKAESDADLLKKKGELAAKQLQMDLQKEMDEILQKEKRKLHEEAERLKQREDKMEKRMGLVEKKLSDIEKREAILAARKSQLDEEKLGVAEKLEKLKSELEKISTLELPPRPKNCCSLKLPMKSKPTPQTSHDRHKKKQKRNRIKSQAPLSPRRSTGWLFPALQK